MPPFELLVRKCPRDLETMQAIANALACPPELDRKASVLKTPDSLVTGHEEIKLVLTSELPS